MAYLNSKQIEQLDFKAVGENVLISDKASIYNSELIEIGDNSRIDDFCILSGNIQIGRNVHITPMCLIAGGSEGIIMEDFTTYAYGVKIFSQSDDYSGETMANSTVPAQYKNEFKKQVIIKKYSVIGAGSSVMPGVTISEGTSVGAMSLVLENTLPWSIYAGVPVKRLKDKSKEMLNLVNNYLNSESHDSI